MVTLQINKKCQSRFHFRKPQLNSRTRRKIYKHSPLSDIKLLDKTNTYKMYVIVKLTLTAGSYRIQALRKTYLCINNDDFNLQV